MLINGESLANESEQLPPNTQEPPQVFPHSNRPPYNPRNPQHPVSTPQPL